MPRKNPEKKAKGRRADHDGQISPEGTGYRARVVVGYDPKTGRPKKKSRKVATYEEACAAVREMLALHAAGKLAPAADRNLGGYLQRWLEHVVRPNRATATYLQYEWVVRVHILPHLGKKRVDAVTRADVQRLLALKSEQRAQPKSPGGEPGPTLSRRTLEAIRAVLHAAYEHAIGVDGVAAVNPADRVVLPKKQQKRVPSLTPNQAARLLREAERSDMPVLWRFFLTTGCRLGEATALRWRDVDLEAGTATICGHLERVKGGGLVWVGTTKTHQVRDIPLGERLAREMAELRLQQQVDGVSDPDGIVFLNVYGRRLDPKFVWSRLRKLGEAAGVPKIHPHMLRHTAATLAQMATGDIHATKNLLGHQNISLTANLYAKTVDEKKRRLAERLERIYETGGED